MWKDYGVSFSTNERFEKISTQGDFVEGNLEKLVWGGYKAPSNQA